MQSFCREVYFVDLLVPIVTSGKTAMSLTNTHSICKDNNTPVMMMKDNDDVTNNNNDVNNVKSNDDNTV